jgi:inhibitor of KinA sporulation pathway (predicted exonuclease)
MSKRLDQVLIIDVESTCWDIRPQQGQMSEIIEIGLCTVDLASLERRERRAIFVKPMRSEVSPFCTQLTSITPQMVAHAEPLSVAVDILKHEYHSRDRLFASWGDYDRNQFQRNCQTYSLEYPFGPTHINVKNLFATALGMSREVGIDAAFEKLGLTMEGTHHRGVDDAWNIAHIFCLLYKRIRRGSM